MRGVAARLAADCATADELAAIRAAHERSRDPGRRAKTSPAGQVVTARGLTSSSTGRAHHQLRADVIATTAFDLAERVRAAERLRERYPATGIHEHAAIVDAITAWDGALAEQLMRAHLTRTGEFFLALRSGAGEHTGAELRR